MPEVLSPEIRRAAAFLLYRYRFIGLYVVFGVLSLVLEIACYRALQHFQIPTPAAIVAGLCASVLFAFWTNVRFNFKVPVGKRNRALFYFAAISCLSAAINLTFRRQLLELGWSYEGARFGVSAIVFSFAYVLHRRFSFVDRKQVGVAVYANGVEDIRAIREKIGDFSDFIHVDLIDSSFGASDTDVRSYRLETVQAYWQRRRIHVHLMTRHPSRWLKDVLPFADLIIVHHEIEEPLAEVFAAIRAAGKQAGLALGVDTPVEAARPWLGQVAVVMLLSIAQPGRSGQAFELKTLENIDAVNKWPERPQFALCVDGGVNEANIHLLNVELVVSGSSVLRAADPARQIMRLQTSSSYEAV